MDRSGIMSVERMPSVLSVESNVGSTSKQGDPSCWSERMALQTALTLSDTPHALNIYARV